MGTGSKLVLLIYKVNSITYKFSCANKKGRMRGLRHWDDVGQISTEYQNTLPITFICETT